jgi:hypothetical protein
MDEQAESTHQRKIALSPAARLQPRGLVSVGTGGIREGQAGEQADLPVDRVFDLPLVTGRRRNTNRSDF